MKSYVIVLFLIVSCIDVLAQKIYLRPYAGMEFDFSRFENKRGVPKYIKKSSNNIRGVSDLFAPCIGLILTTKNEIWTFELGFEETSIGDGLRAVSHSDSAIYKTSRGRAFGAFSKRIVLRTYKKISQVKIRKGDGFIFKLLDPHHRTHFFGFEVEAVAGFSYDWIHPFNESTLSVNILPPPPNAQGMIHSDDISLAKSITWWNPRGWGIQGGINLQFRNSRGNRSLQIGLLYHQGLNKRIVTTWQTAVNGVQYPDFNTVSRGSMMSIYVGMPIRLITFGGEPKRY